MALESQRKLYDGVSKYIDIGEFDSFSKRMQDHQDRQSFYDNVSPHVDIGSYEDFELRISSPAPAVKLDSVLIDPDEGKPDQSSYKNIIYESVKQQENSVATNNPYGVNLPRKKINADRIFGSGGKVMAGSSSLLEFDSLEKGLKAGEEIIDNILNISNDDPAAFYSNYSGLPIESPEVKSFTEIVNERSKGLKKPAQLEMIPGLLEALEYNKNNPRYIMKAAKGTDAVSKIKNISSNVPISKQTEQLQKRLLGIDKKEKREEVFEPSAKDLAIFEKERQFKILIAKEKKENGLSDLDAYKKVRKIYGTGDEFIANAFEQSVTGSLFRIFGVDAPMMKSKKELALYREALEKDPNLLSHSKFEQLAASALSLVTPVDKLLFTVGGGLSKLKAVGKGADKAAIFIAKKTKIPLAQARVYMKTAFERITGGAGGFAAFDAGRNITSQIEETGQIDPLEVVEESMKGLLVGSLTSGLGLTGSVVGKKYVGNAGEIVGLGTVAPMSEG